MELALIECAQATDDDPGAGRRPARILKPLFSLQAAAALEAPSPAPSSGAPASGAPASASPSPSAPRPWAAPPTSATPAKPRVKLGSMLSSLRINRPEPAAPSASASTAASAASTAPVEHQPVDASALIIHWQQFIGTMPQSETAIAQRMRIMQPVVNDAATGALHLTLDNKEVLTMMQQVQPRLETYLRQQLHNSSLSIAFDVAEQTAQAVRVYDKHEQFRHRAELNPALVELKNTFQLELE